MKSPFASTANLARLATILCAVLSITFCLCGVTGASIAMSDDFLVEAPNYTPKLMFRILALAAVVEAYVMAACVLALAIVAFVWIGRNLSQGRSKSR